MEKKLFRTKINDEHKLAGNLYVYGRISGIKHILCDECAKVVKGNSKYPDGTFVFNTECTEEQYATFVEIVENDYPGLCTFYY